MTIHDALAENSVEHVDDRKGVTRHTGQSHETVRPKGRTDEVVAPHSVFMDHRL